MHTAIFEVRSNAALVDRFFADGGDHEWSWQFASERTQACGQGDLATVCMCNCDQDTISEARDWIADCEWADGVNAGELTDAQVMRGVQRHYEGGWAQFVKDVNRLPESLPSYG